MSMNSWLSELYGTPGAAKEAADNTAQLEKFASLAAEQGIDLSALSSDQVRTLYEATFKTASDDGDADDKDEGSDAKGTEEEAKAEHEGEKEAQAKFAEADMMGRVMAHALYQELGEIEKSAGVGESVREGLAAVKSLAQRKGTRLKGIAERAGSNIAAGARKATGAVSSATGVTDLRKAVQARGGKSLATGKDIGRNHLAHGLGRAGATAAGVGAVGAGGAYGAKKLKKEGSALDHLAAQQAVKIAEAAGYDVNQCVELLTQADAQGAFEGSDKIAHVQDFNDAVHVRGLELLETVGYPVNWSEIFG